MLIKALIQEAIDKNALGFEAALKEELRSRVGRGLADKMRHLSGNVVNEAEYEIGGEIHQMNHADMAQMHREMAERHRKMGGRFNMKAAQEHKAAAKEQEAAADHIYSFERSNKVHTATHEPAMIAARAVLDRAAAQSKAAFSASHLADAEDKD